MNKNVLFFFACFTLASSLISHNLNSTVNRYVLYDVNYGEGFNLRRDVYVRFANLVRFLNSRQSSGIKWTLVLPPWGRLYHWFNSRHLERLPWSTFFDVSSLGLFVPVVEFEQFLTDTDGAPIDKVYYLQSLPFDGKWSERVELRPCETSSHSYHYSKNLGHWLGWLYGFTDQPIREFECLSTQAEAKTLVDFILKQAPVQSLMFDRGESLIHGSYSEWSPEWWTARRSMVFAKRLRQLATEFRLDQLNSTDAADRTERPDDWRTLVRPEGSALGGPYLAVHMRRQDFVSAHPDAAPPPASVAPALRRLAESLGLPAVFLATDDPSAESKLAPLLKPLRILSYRPAEGRPPLDDGELAIVDQILCSHARQFVGTQASTFSLRIIEERSLLGFARASSNSVLCPDGGISGVGGGGSHCESATYWQPQYEKDFTLRVASDPPPPPPPPPQQQQQQQQQYERQEL